MLEQHTPQDFIGSSSAFLEMIEKASALATLDRPLIIAGERGVGKELLASRIHFLSLRWEQPLIKINCATLDSDLLSSTLFGHEAGAFTGALKQHHGVFERAAEGTLFLDEIATLTPAIQEKLLRVVEYGTFERLGGDKTLVCDTRLLCASNEDLATAARTHRFRADLLDRLAFEVIHVPPLRQRTEDIIPLANHFARQFAVETNLSHQGFTNSAAQKLHAYHWPGNIRELKNAAERSFFHWRQAHPHGPVDAVRLDPFAQTAAQNQLTEPADPRPPWPDFAQPICFKNYIDATRKALLEGALAHTNGNLKKAAVTLGMRYDQLRYCLRTYAKSQPGPQDKPR